MKSAVASSPPGATTSIDKALEVCEALSLAPSGLALTDVSRAVSLPRPSVHRLLAILKRRGYVRQDEESQRYSLTLKMLDLSFRLLGRSELRLHAYPVLREYVLRGRPRSFVAVPAAAEVTYIWGAGPDEAAMRTAYGKQSISTVRPRPAGGSAACGWGVPETWQRAPRCWSGWARRWPTAGSGCIAPAHRCMTTRGGRWRASACSGTGPTTAPF
jgi:DNA-binding transcriptional ArsR family regulator